MPYEFKLPDVGEGMEEGELIRWLVNVGDEVEEDQPVAEIQTDKVQTELYSPVAGTVMELLAQEGDLIPVGSVFVNFETEGDSAPVEDASSGSEESVPRALAAESTGDHAGPVGTSVSSVDSSEAPAPGVSEPKYSDARPEAAENGAKERRKSRATPAVRRVARELGVDIELVDGSGSGGRIMESDVRAYSETAVGVNDSAPKQNGSQETTEDTDDKETTAGLAPSGSAPGPEHVYAGGYGFESPERIPLRGIRRAMYTNMSRSSSTVAHSFGLEEMDVSELVALRKQMGRIAQDKELRLTYLPFVIKAAVTALKEFPYLNASVDDAEQQIVLHKRYDIGVAVDTPQGLLVPVLRGASERSIFGLARGIVDLAGRGREGDLGMEDFKGATFTVTNVGSIGGIAAMPVVDHPQVAILGLHRIQRKPVVLEGDEIVARDVMNMSLGFDHRVIDGATCFNFLARTKELIENPNLLFMEMA